MKYFIEKPLAFVGFVTQKQKYALPHAKSAFGRFTKSPPLVAFSTSVTRLPSSLMVLCTTNGSCYHVSTSADFS